MYSPDRGRKGPRLKHNQGDSLAPKRSRYKPRLKAQTAAHKPDTNVPFDDGDVPRKGHVGELWKHNYRARPDITPPPPPYKARPRKRKRTHGELT